MSSKIKGLRRVGIVGLSTVVAASMMSLSAVSASAVPPVYAALTAPVVTQGATNQAAGSLTLDIANSTIVTNSAQTFSVGGNNCATAAGIAMATEFAAVPTAAMTGPFVTGATTAGTAPTPVFTTTLGSSSTQCATAGIQDVVTLSITLAGTGELTDWFKYTLSNVLYNVGTTTAPGNLSVVTAGSFPATPATVPNASVVNQSFTFIPVITAQVGSTGNTLGTATFVETEAGSIFTTAGTATPVTLVLSAGDFTAGVTPTITVPAGYVATKPVTTTTTGNTYSFTVTPAATLVKATVTVSGLKFDDDAVTTENAGVSKLVTLTADAGAFSPDAMNAVKVLDYNDRTGGVDRYATAAALFTKANNTGVFNHDGVAPTTASSVVLSSGFDFPDALSANYLAGRLNTGTLLTKPDTLSPAARTAILGSGVSTVYITGETGAVSRGVETQVEALHVGNSLFNPFITVIRLGGDNRFVTNQIINENDFTVANTVLLASGQDFPDALALGPIAVNRHFPLILTRGVTLGSTENAQLADFSPANVIIAGGIGVVSAGIEASLKAQGFNVVRLAGDNRTQTAAAVATWATVGVSDTATGISDDQGFSSSKTYIARGDDFADALAAGPVAGADIDDPSVIMLTSTSTALGVGIPAYLGTKTVATSGTSATHVDSLHALGLTGAVTNAMMRAAAVTVGP